MEKTQTELQKALKDYLKKNPSGERVLASKLGLMPKSIKRWLNGVSEPNPLVAQAIINYLKKKEAK